MGDAAHAASPAIGMGMNIALQDAQVFVELLDNNDRNHCNNNVGHRRDDDDDTLWWDTNIEFVMKEFSNMRVKEGYAMVELGYNLVCHDSKAYMMEVVRWQIRSTLHKWFPSWMINPHPQDVLGKLEWTMTDMYNLANKLGILKRHRSINYDIRRQHHERELGIHTYQHKNEPNKNEQKKTIPTTNKI